MREAKIKRETKETQISVELNLDGKGLGTIATGVPFLDHMLDQFRRHAFLDLTIEAKGDNHIDDHHTVEDIGITLGQAIKSALGDRSGVQRWGSARVVMDEALITCDLDLSNRPFLVYEIQVNKERINTFETELCVEFWRALAFNAGITLHFNQISGVNSHHIIEASFKAFALAFDRAKTLDARIQSSRSTKGSL